MSDEEIRDLLDLGAEEFDFGPPIEAEDTWAAGRRSRTRRAWGVGLGAVAAAAGIVGVVWAQGLGGGEVETPPPADGTLTAPQPTLTSTEQGRGEPFFAEFHRVGDEAPAGHSGASEPATVEDLQGTWIGPDGEEFVFTDDQLAATFEGCSHLTGSISLSEDSRLQAVGDWEGTDDDGECATQEPLVAWAPALQQAPLLTIDGDTLIISGLDGTSQEPRVTASLTVRAADEAGLIWENSEPQGEGSPVALGEDFQLMVSGDAEDITLTSISDLNLESPGLCGQVMVSSLRSDGILLAGPPQPWPVCTEGEDALPPAEPSAALVALLRSAPTVTFTDGTMTLTGSIPESLGQSAPAPDEGTATGDPADDDSTTTAPEGGQEPPVSGDPPEVVGVPQLIVMSEGDWSPSGELTLLTAEEAAGKRWLPVTTESDPPEVGADVGGERGLAFDGDTWRLRECGIDITVPGGLQDGALITTGKPDVVPDPDPGAACVFERSAQEWVQILTNEPRLSTDGDILVIAGGVGDVTLEPVSIVMSLQGRPTSTDVDDLRLTPEALAMGLAELPESEALGEGVEDVRDPQPEHTTNLSVEDGILRVDVGCSEPLQGPAWYSHVGPEDVHWQLTAALPEASGCTGSAGADAELWRQMLAHGVFLFPLEGHRIVDSWAEPATP